MSDFGRLRDGELDRILRKVSSIHPAEIDASGRQWWDSRQICAALHLDARRALPAVRGQYKRRTHIYVPGFRDSRPVRVSIEGVKTLIMLKPGLPLAETIGRLISEE